MTTIVEVTFKYDTLWTRQEKDTFINCLLGNVEGDDLFEKVDGMWQPKNTWEKHMVFLDSNLKTSGLDIRDVVSKVSKRIDELVQHAGTQVNYKCRVAVAGLGTLSIRKVQLHSDLCTDALQRLLDEGWSILAICVQPDQRRPDYIMGRDK
jgi:hypothetical protein